MYFSILLPLLFSFVININVVSVIVAIDLIVVIVIVVIIIIIVIIVVVIIVVDIVVAVIIIIIIIVVVQQQQQHCRNSPYQSVCLHPSIHPFFIIVHLNTIRHEPHSFVGGHLTPHWWFEVPRR